jgi:hypothetical protein
MALFGSDSDDGTVTKTKLDIGTMQNCTRVVDHEAGVVIYRIGNGVTALPIDQTDLDPAQLQHSNERGAGWNE